MKSLIFAVAIVGASLQSGPLLAQMDIDPAVAEAIQTNILDQLQAGRPDLEFSDIKASDLQGYYRVDVTRGPALYIAQDGSHFFSGELYASTSVGIVNLTEMDNAAHRLEMLAMVKDEDKIIFSPEGNTKGILTVFTDVTCAYCRRLHSHIEEFSDLGIEIQYLAFPRSGIERNGSLTKEYLETAKAWCSEDRLQAMTNLKGGTPVSEQVCENNPVAEQYRLGIEFGVTGTPAIVLPDGTLLPGYRTPAEFARILGIPAS